MRGPTVAPQERVTPYEALRALVRRAGAAPGSVARRGTPAHWRASRAGPGLLSPPARAGPGGNTIAVLGARTSALLPPAPQPLNPYPPGRQTINGAYINNEDNVKGSLQPGKLADMVIVDRNPLTAEPNTIKDIKVTGSAAQAWLPAVTRPSRGGCALQPPRRPAARQASAATHAPGGRRRVRAPRAPCGLAPPQVLEVLKEGQTVYKRPVTGPPPVVAPQASQEQLEEGVHPPPTGRGTGLTPAQAGTVAGLLAATAP